MKRGFRGAPRPLLPSMLLVATNPNAGQAHDAVAPSQPSSSTPPVPSTSSPPAVTAPTPIPTPTPPPIPSPTQITDTEPTPFEHTYEESFLTTPNFLHPPTRTGSKSWKSFVKVNLVFSDSEEEEPEVQGRKSQDDPLDSLVQGLVTPSTTKVNASGEEQMEDISPNTLEAAKTLSKDRREVVSSLDFQEEVDAGAEQVNTASAEQVSTAEGVNTGSIKLSTGDEQLSTGNEQVSTVGAKKSTSDQDKGQREGKAPMISEETPKKSKEQVLQEEASLAEAIRLDTLQKEEVAKQVHLDSLLAQRIAEEEELNEQQKKRKAQVQFEAQHYTNEDWDLIRAKIEANAELSKSMLGSELQGEDFAKKMVDLVNQRKKYFAEERAKAKRNKPMTQSQLKTYMMNYLKNQRTWKLFELKNLSFEEVKKKFDKLVKQTKTPKRLKDDKDDEAKDDEQTKKSGKRRKQMARKGLHTSFVKIDSEDTVKWCARRVCHREDGTDIVYINFGAMMKSISRMILMSCIGCTDPIWSEVGQQKIISWRYYESCRVHCLNLESMDVYMLIERTYPLSAEMCKAMLDKKLQGGKPDENCYKMLKMMEKQAGIRK
ncbi:hypothetical protein Tco_0189790 [Tanacetum coccineum]